MSKIYAYYSKIISDRGFNCVICGDPVKTSSRLLRLKYCSISCGAKAHKLSKMQFRHVKNCSTCGDMFLTSVENTRKHYCSDPCREKGYRARRCHHGRKLTASGKSAEYARTYYHASGENTVKARLRRRLRGAFNRFADGKKAGQAKKYGINWDAICRNIGPCPGPRADWHIDHIVPLSSFDFSNPLEVAMAFAPDNHQWLTAEENMKKVTNGRRRKTTAEVGVRS